jgi:hypothetical protein
MSKIELKPEAVALLQRVKAHILEEPLRLNMDNWRTTNIQDDAYFDEDEHAGIPPCRTVACIAGWAVGLGAKRPGAVKNVKDYALKLLGLPKDYSAGEDWMEGSTRLFHPLDWPADLRRKLPEVGGTPEYAAVVAEAIDRFIASPEEFS